MSEYEENLSVTVKFNKNYRKNYPTMEIPLNSSETKESKGKKYDTEDPDTICGFGKFRPNWLQPWATPKIYLVMYSLTGIVSQTYLTYRIGVMSTLEHRFAFKSKITGSIMVMEEFTPLLFGPLVGYFGGRTHRPRVIGLGTFLTALCCFISALPYVVYGPAKQFNDLSSVMSTNGSDLQQCDDTVRLKECDADDRPPTITAVFLLMVAGILRGFGNLTHQSVGISYMDDNSKRKNSPMYFAIASVLSMVGPLLGFLMSTICLKYSENPLDDPGYGPNDPRWVGSWWMGFVLQGFLLLLAAIPIALFPKRLPGVKNPVDRPGTDKRINFSGMFSAVKRILLNPLLCVIMLNEIAYAYGYNGHAVMLPKYMEHQFRLTTSDASLYSGVPVIGAAMIAETLGGYLIWKFRPSLKFLLGAMIVSQTIKASGYLVLMIPKCEKIEMANFGMGKEGLILEGSCNMNCNCSTESFTPVCGSDLKTLYFNPCYAGCGQNLNKTFFNNCSCISESSNMENFATEGFCMSENCWLQAIAYIIAWPTIQFIVSILVVMQKLMILRCTQPEDKTLAIGIYEAITSSLGFVPYLIIFGAMVDSACLVWESSCEETGNCWFYDMHKLNNIIHGMSAGFSFVSVGTMCLIFCLRGRFCDLYEEDFFYEEKEELNGHKKHTAEIEMEDAQM